MKHNKELKEEAIKLRKRGRSYKEIQEDVPVSKSTLSLWLKTIHLKPEHKERLYTKQIQILSRGPQSQKERRKREIEEIIKKAREEITFPLSSQTYKLFGTALYWAEGSKSKSVSEVTNSDPHLILFMVNWFEKVFNIPKETFTAKLNVYPQQNDKKMKKFWSDLTGIPLKNFQKSYVKPLSKGYKKNTLYYGTIRIYIPRAADIKQRIFGWAQATLQDVDTKVQSIQRRWKSLANTKRPPVNIDRP